MLIRWTLGLGLVGMLSVAGAWSLDLLPSQERERVLPVAHAKQHSFGEDKKEVGVKKGDEGLAAFVEFSSTKVGFATLPDIITFDVELTKKIPKDWYIASIWGWRGDPVTDAQNAVVHLPVAESIDDTLRVWRANWFHLHAGQRYTLEIRLNMKSPTDASEKPTKPTSEEKNRIAEERNKTIKDLAERIRRDPTDFVHLKMYYRD